MIQTFCEITLPTVARKHVLSNPGICPAFHSLLRRRNPANHNPRIWPIIDPAILQTNTPHFTHTLARHWLKLLSIRHPKLKAQAIVPSKRNSFKSIDGTIIIFKEFRPLVSLLLQKVSKIDNCIWNLKQVYLTLVEERSAQAEIIRPSPALSLFDPSRPGHYILGPFSIFGRSFVQGHFRVSKTIAKVVTYA